MRASLFARAAGINSASWARLIDKAVPDRRNLNDDWTDLIAIIGIGK